MKKVIIWAIVVAVTLWMAYHWGFFGLIIFTIGYGLWAENRKDDEKGNTKK